MRNSFVVNLPFGATGEKLGSTVATSTMTDYMSEVEVSLRLGFWILEQPGALPSVRIALDGACAQVFPIRDFLAAWDHSKLGNREWQGTFQRENKTIEIHSTNSRADGSESVSDIEATINGTRLRLECKAVLKRIQGRIRLQSAIGQMVTLRDPGADDLLGVAVPYSNTLKVLRRQFLTAPLFKRTGIQIALVHRDGRVDGLTLPGTADII